MTHIKNINVIQENGRHGELYAMLDVASFLVGLR